MKSFTDTIAKKLGITAAILASLGAITMSPYRLALKMDVDALAAEFQQEKCISIQMRLNDAYARRDDYKQRGEATPSWLSQQIAELEQYIRAYC